MYWRLTLDNPTVFPIESGSNHSRHCTDFSSTAGSYNKTYRCPTTGVVMLLPSTFDPNAWNTGTQPIANFMVQGGVSVWQACHRSISTNYFTNTATGLTNILPGIALPSVGSGVVPDSIVWALQSNYMMGVDESFTINYNSVNDEYTRADNWLMLQWDNIGIHISANGTCRVFKYDASNMSTAPKQVDEFQIASFSQIHGKDGYFWVMPIPTLGVVIQHSSIPQRSSLKTMFSEHTSSRGHLIPWSPTLVGGTYKLFNTSPLRIGVNPSANYVFSVERVTFPSSGTFLDAPFSLDYLPTQTPVVLAVPLNTTQSNITSVLLKQDGSAPFVQGVDQGARVSSTLTTTDTYTTPFMFGYETRWPPLLATRATTPYSFTTTTIGGAGAKILALDYTEDDIGAWEGTVHMLITNTAIMKIAERGDASFLLENSTNGTTWITVNGGLAKNWKNEYVSDGGSFYMKSSCSLHDMREQLKENHALHTGVFDGKKISDAINLILTCSGFAPIAIFPADATSKIIPIPIDGKSWRFEAREGDDCLEYIHVLLLFLRQQGIEYRIRFDWPTFAWVIEKKPHLVTPFWTLSPTHTDESLVNRTWHYSTASFETEPPEGNSIVIKGSLTSADSRIATEVDTALISVGPMVNLKSVTDPTSPDYLGRKVHIQYRIFPLVDEGELALMLHRFYNAICFHHGIVRDIYLPIAQFAITPASRVIVQKKSGTTQTDGWVKKRTVHVHDSLESMTLEIDTVWEGEVPRA